MLKDIEFKFYSLGTLNAIWLYGCENETVTDVILKRMEDAIFITDSMDIRITKGLKDNFIMKRTDNYDRRNIYVC